MVKSTLKMKRRVKASSQKLPARFVVATMMPSRFSIASRQMFWMAFIIWSTLEEGSSMRLEKMASASLKRRMGAFSRLRQSSA